MAVPVFPETWPAKQGGSLAGKDSSAASSILSQLSGGSRIDSGPAGLIVSGAPFRRLSRMLIKHSSTTLADESNMGSPYVYKTE